MFILLDLMQIVYVFNCAVVMSFLSDSWYVLPWVSIDLLAHVWRLVVRLEWLSIHFKSRMH
jgi:hypothetical protein